MVSLIEGNKIQILWENRPPTQKKKDILNLNKIASERKSHAPPRRFLYLRETKSWKAERR